MKRNIFLMAAVAVSIMLLGSCNSEVADDANASVAKIDTTHCTTFVIKETPTTRVSITGHVPNGGAVVNWIPDDKLWLRTPADARIGSMGNNLTGVSAWAKFYFPAGYNDATYQVNYLGHTTRTDGRHVTIHPSQWQAVANNTDHLQYVGDCAEGTAYRDANKAGVYNLTLRRLPAYLCIMPYCTNEMLRPGAKITKIVVRSDNAITGTFDVAASKFAAGTNLGTQIENALNSGNGFSLENNVPNQALNAAYFVIVPGGHNLSIDYYMTTAISSKVTKVTKNVPYREYKSNTITDIYANLDVLGIEPKYYMWDAAVGQDLFSGNSVVWGQPINWPQNSSDPRWYNDKANLYWGERSTKDITPALAVWYAYADPYYDADMEWSVDGHVYKGGVWFVHSSVIESGYYNTWQYNIRNVMPNNGYFTPYNSIVSNSAVNTSILNSPTYKYRFKRGRPTLEERRQKKYFFLPNLGLLPNGTTNYTGPAGDRAWAYWVGAIVKNQYQAIAITINPADPSCFNLYRYIATTALPLISDFEP